MKRILIISNMFPSELDPTYGTFVKNFYSEAIQYLDNCSIELCVINRRLKGIRKLISYLRFILKGIMKVSFKKYDLIYVHYITWSSLPLLIPSTFKNLNVAFNIHGDDLLVRTNHTALLLKMVEPILKKSNLIVVPSLFFKDVLLEKIKGIKSQCIYISPSGGIHKSFYFKQLEIQSVNQIKLGYVSRIDANKGWDVFISAIEELLNKGINVTGEIVGLGTQIRQMNNMIKIKHLDKYINYRGALTHEKLPSFYKRLDLFVFPTMLEESLGLVGIEAMASSIPVIGSDIGGLKTFIRNGFNGFLFQPGNVDDLVNRIVDWQKLNIKQKVELKTHAYHTATMYEASKVSFILFEKINSVYNLA